MLTIAALRPKCSRGACSERTRTKNHAALKPQHCHALPSRTAHNQQLIIGQGTFGEEGRRREKARGGEGATKCSVQDADPAKRRAGSKKKTPASAAPQPAHPRKAEGRGAGGRTWPKAPARAARRRTGAAAGGSRGCATAAPGGRIATETTRRWDPQCAPGRRRGLGAKGSQTLRPMHRAQPQDGSLLASQAAHLIRA